MRFLTLGLITVAGIAWSFLSVSPTVGQGAPVFFPDTTGPHYVIDIDDGCAEWASNILTTTGDPCGSGSGGGGVASTSIDTETELEAFLTDVTDVFTNNDGALDDDDLTDDSIEALSDVAAMTENYGDLLFWNGSSWADHATSTLGINFSNLVGTADISTQTNLTAGDALTLTNDDIDFDGGATPAGDLGNTWADPSVDDDSHAHTGTTISGLGFADTVITAGDALTITGDDIDFDGGTAPGGSLGGTWASPTIDDLFILNTGDIGTGHYVLPSLAATFATTTQATTTSLAVLNLTSANCDVKSTTGGIIFCGTDSEGAGGGWAFTPSTKFGVNTQSTTTALDLRGTPFSLFASSTAVLTNASTSQLSFASALYGTGDTLIDGGTSHSIGINGSNYFYVDSSGPFLQGAGINLVSAGAFYSQSSGNTFQFSNGTRTGTLDFASLASSDKTFTFPNLTGTFALGTGSAGQLAYWTNTNQITNAATTSLTIGASLAHSGTAGALVGGTAGTLSLNTANSNTWSVLQSFALASTSKFSCFLNCYFGGTATSSFSSAGVLTLATDLAVSEGGTGASTLTDHGVLVGSGTSAIDALSVGTNGQLLIGSTGADPIFAALNCADGLTCTTGAGTLEIDFDGGNAPLGELGGTWASPTLDDSVAVTSWTLTTPSIATSLTVTDDDWIGLGSGAGRITWDDITIDVLNVENARFGIASSTPMSLLGVNGTTTTNTLHVTSPNHTGTTTMYLYSDTASRGAEIILEDSDGAGCTSITVLNGTVSGLTVACPDAPAGG